LDNTDPKKLKKRSKIIQKLNDMKRTNEGRNIDGSGSGTAHKKD
jgi:hypothetical protein